MRGIRKQSSDTQSSSQPKEKRGLDTKQKKGMLIGGGIFLVAVIALILVKNLTGGSGADGENVLYAGFRRNDYRDRTWDTEPFYRSG